MNIGNRVKQAMFFCVLAIIGSAHNASALIDSQTYCVTVTSHVKNIAGEHTCCFDTEISGTLGDVYCALDTIAEVADADDTWYRECWITAEIYDEDGNLVGGYDSCED